MQAVGDSPTFSEAAAHASWTGRAKGTPSKQASRTVHAAGRLQRLRLHSAVGPVQESNLYLMYNADACHSQRQPWVPG